MNTLIKKGAIVALAVAGLMAVDAKAQIISFEETGSGGNLSGDYPIDFLNDTISGITLTGDSNLDLATLSLGSGATAGGAGGSLGFGSAGDDNSLANAIAGNNYHSISLTPSSGFQLNISGISYNADASSSSSTFVFDVLSSATGFTSSDSLGTLSVINSAAASGTIDTSLNSSLQGLTSNVELRVYVHRSNGGGTAAYYADDGVNSGLFSIDGTVTAVPEPSTFVLLALGLGSLFFARRRQK